MRIPPALSAALLAVTSVLTAGCATVEHPPGGAEVTPFSTAQPGNTLPESWRPWTLSMSRQPTRYELVNDGAQTVVKATARDSASGLIHSLDIDPGAQPILTWRWKLDYFPPTSEESPDDSPVRVIVSFDGDLEKLPFSDRIFYANFRVFTGQPLPYAALMYIWGTKSALDSIQPTKHTGRVKMITVERGPDGLGKWQELHRDVHEDFRRAFGEEPGHVVSIGFMTETDEAKRDVEAWYGDFAFRPAAQNAASR